MASNKFEFIISASVSGFKGGAEPTVEVDFETVDEFVRCEQCRFYNNYDFKGGTEIYCTMLDSSAVPAWGYCWLGERK